MGSLRMVCERRKGSAADDLPAAKGALPKSRKRDGRRQTTYSPCTWLTDPIQSVESRRMSATGKGYIDSPRVPQGVGGDAPPLSMCLAHGFNSQSLIFSGQGERGRGVKGEGVKGCAARSARGVRVCVCSPSSKGGLGGWAVPDYLPPILHPQTLSTANPHPPLTK